uniref:Phosphatase and actin regulator n=1 Tax=Neogobius melanostomus TaxID=47308 RepID=A0A8C6S9T4_9GOBI
MAPPTSPAAFHGQIRSLERARTENFLKHKIRSRPERAELVRMHILKETGAEPSLQATQMKLKRARLADDLNEKIAQRPGPMELVEKNILPVDSTLKQAIIGEKLSNEALHCSSRVKKLLDLGKAELEKMLSVKLGGKRLGGVFFVLSMCNACLSQWGR